MGKKKEKEGKEQEKSALKKQEKGEKQMVAWHALQRLCLCTAATLHGPWHQHLCHGSSSDVIKSQAWHGVTCACAALHFCSACWLLLCIPWHQIVGISVVTPPHGARPRRSVSFSLFT